MRRRSLAGLLIALAAVVAAGCASSAAKVHSPAEVGGVFAAHGLAVESPAWSTAGSVHTAIPVSEAVINPTKHQPTTGGSVAQQIVKAASGPPPRGDLGLIVTVWTSIAAAKKDESTFNNSPLLPQLAGHPHESRVDNVTAMYFVIPSNAQIRARMLKALAAIAKTPGVSPPQAH